MLINSVNSLNFNAKFKTTKVYMEGKNNTTLRCTVSANQDIPFDIKSLKCDTLQNGKILETLSYKNKQGFNEDDEFCQFCEDVQKRMPKDSNFFEKFIAAIMQGGN